LNVSTGVGLMLKGALAKNKKEVKEGLQRIVEDRSVTRIPAVIDECTHAEEDVKELLRDALDARHLAGVTIGESTLVTRLVVNRIDIYANVRQAYSEQCRGPVPGLRQDLGRILRDVFVPTLRAPREALFV